MNPRAIAIVGVCLLLVGSAQAARQTAPAGKTAQKLPHSVVKGQRFPRLTHTVQAGVKGGLAATFSWLGYYVITGDASGGMAVAFSKALVATTVGAAALDMGRASLNHLARTLPRRAQEKMARWKPLSFLTLKSQLKKDDIASSLREKLISVVNLANELSSKVAHLPKDNAARQRVDLARSMLGTDRKGQVTGTNIARSLRSDVRLEIFSALTSNFEFGQPLSSEDRAISAVARYLDEASKKLKK